MNALAGTSTLIRLILRRDRIVLPLWIILVALVPVSMAASYAELYPTAEALQAFADASMSTTATVGMLGYIYAPTIGGLTAWRAGLNGMFLIVSISILFLIRHTRTEEEAGRRELLGSTVVGRHAPLAAALIVVGGSNLLIGAIIAGGLIAQGLPAAGAITLGLSATCGACAFTALAAVAAQLTHSPGPARAIALVIFALSWVVRAVGDLGQPDGLGWLAWLSPLGWVRLTRAFAGEQWGVFGLFLSLTAVLVVAAFWLSARRDVGAGLLPARPGPASASPALRNPLALAWRLNSGSLIGWSGGVAFFGFLLGTLGFGMSRFVDAPQMRAWAAQMGMADAGDAFLYMVMYVLGQVISAYAIVMALRLRSEELEWRADPLLAAPVSRLKWASSHLIVALVGPAILLLSLGLAIGLGYGLAAGDVGHDLPRLLARTLTPLPAIWVMVGLAAALYGLLPRLAAPVTWGLLVVFFALELGWELQQINPSLFNLSPFAYVHWTIPVAAISLIGLTAFAAALVAAGLVGFRRRNIGTG